MKPKSSLAKALNGTYTLSKDGKGTKVVYELEIDPKIPMMGFMKRKAAATIADSALHGLKRHCERAEFSRSAQGVDFSHAVRGRRENSQRHVDERRRKLAASRRLNLVAAVLARFKEIDGANQGVLISVQVFTVVIPLMILGFSFFNGFAENLSAGTI